ncbi:uncharacterized protein HD556DRAFT_1479962 [Suillus plorans]|uniref:Uncharacterized protein n=1 Tax=Suillus plorans TaxID=116603 RepID=A0A9P7ANH2_9AGAM|nr:uncharacterized protein HD556DRAFT_1479962 [Suillus plorans]KAG1793195.1 hypothetical protein HD556DRAFT_1479962 [Suillus plorans]
MASTASSKVSASALAYPTLPPSRSLIPAQSSSTSQVRHRRVNLLRDVDTAQVPLVSVNGESISRNEHHRWPLSKERFAELQGNDMHLLPKRTLYRVREYGYPRTTEHQSSFPRDSRLPRAPDILSPHVPDKTVTAVITTMLVLRVQFAGPIDLANDEHYQSWAKFQKAGEVVEEIRRHGADEYIIEMGLAGLDAQLPDQLTCCARAKGTSVAVHPSFSGLCRLLRIYIEQGGEAGCIGGPDSGTFNMEIPAVTMAQYTAGAHVEN